MAQVYAEKYVIASSVENSLSSVGNVLAETFFSASTIIAAIIVARVSNKCVNYQPLLPMSVRTERWCSRG